MSHDPDRLLALAADAPADSLERHLFIVAAIDALLEATLVVVGGMAVNVFMETYQPTDIDLVGDVTTTDRASLVDLGFGWAGVGHRHLSWEFADGGVVLVEIQSPDFDGARPATWHEVVPGIGVWVIALDELMMDRIRQATDGTSVTLDVAVALATAVHDDIDWSGLEEEIGSPGNRSLSCQRVLHVVRAAATERSGRARSRPRRPARSARSGSCVRRGPGRQACVA